MQLIIINNPLIKNKLLSLSLKKNFRSSINLNIEARIKNIAEIIKAEGIKKIPMLKISSE